MKHKIKRLLKYYMILLSTKNNIKKGLILQENYQTTVQRMIKKRELLQLVHQNTEIAH